MDPYIIAATLVALVPLPLIKSYISSGGNHKIIAALLCYALLAYCYIKIFSVTSVSKSYTIIQVLQVLVVVLFGYLYYAEEVNWWGILFGVLSIYLLS